MEPGAVPGAGDAARVPAPAATETVTPVAAAAAALGPDEVVRLSQFLSRMDLELSQLREQVHGLSMHAVPEGVTAATSGPSGRPVAAPVGASAGAVPAVHAVSARPVLPAQTQHDVRVNLDRSKVWREAFESAQITGEASPDFPMTMNRLARLRETAPPVGAARAELEIEWMSFAFAGHARRYLFQLQERHAGESAWELLARMRQRFYNEIHVTSAKMRWETLKMHERESVQSFAERVSDLATCQAEVPTDKDLLIRFLSGLPASLQEWSLLVGASFPEAVTVVQRNAQRNALRAGRRVVDEVEGEPAGDAGASDGAAGLMQGPQSVPGPGTLVTTVVPQFAWPGGALPVQYGVQSTTSRGQAEQGSERGPRRQAACWYCGKTGHRRDQCRKLLADKAKAEVPKKLVRGTKPQVDAWDPGPDRAELVEEVAELEQGSAGVLYDLGPPDYDSGDEYYGPPGKAEDEVVDELFDDDVESTVEPPLMMLVHVPTSRGNIPIRAKVDTGAAHIFVDGRLFDGLEGEWEPGGAGMRTMAPDGRHLGEGRPGHLMMQAPGLSLAREPVVVLPVLHSQMLVGRDFPGQEAGSN